MSNISTSMSEHFCSIVQSLTPQTAWNTGRLRGRRSYQGWFLLKPGFVLTEFPGDWSLLDIIGLFKLADCPLYKRNNTQPSFKIQREIYSFIGGPALCFQLNPEESLIYRQQNNIMDTRPVWCFIGIQPTEPTIDIKDWI